MIFALSIGMSRVQHFQPDTPCSVGRKDRNAGFRSACYANEMQILQKWMAVRRSAVCSGLMCVQTSCMRRIGLSGPITNRGIRLAPVRQSILPRQLNCVRLYFSVACLALHRSSGCFAGVCGDRRYGSVLNHGESVRTQSSTT